MINVNSRYWRIISVQGKKGPNEHHAMYPVELPWRCIKMHSDKGEAVLEPFSGSGTTIIAAEQTERICYAMELSPVYCDLAVRRYKEFAPDAQICILRGSDVIPADEAGI